MQNTNDDTYMYINCQDLNTMCEYQTDVETRAFVSKIFNFRRQNTWDSHDGIVNIGHSR